MWDILLYNEPSVSVINFFERHNKNKIAYYYLHNKLAFMHEMIYIFNTAITKVNKEVNIALRDTNINC